jgi:hypothetical protein
VTAEKGVGHPFGVVGISRHKESLDLYYAKADIRDFAQLVRTLKRPGTKDVTVDYTRAGSLFFGQGIPEQGPDGVVMRSPYQLRGEMKAVLATARDLVRSAVGEEVARARRAFAAVERWFERVDGELSELVSRGVRGVLVRGSAHDLRERVRLIEQAVATALTRELSFGRDVPELSIEAVASLTQTWRASVESDIARRREIVTRYERVGGVTHPDGLVRREVEAAEARVRRDSGFTFEESSEMKRLLETVKDLGSAGSASAEGARLAEIVATRDARAAEARRDLDAVLAAAKDPALVAQRQTKYEADLAAAERAGHERVDAVRDIASLEGTLEEIAALEATLAVAREQQVLAVAFDAPPTAPIAEQVRAVQRSLSAAREGVELAAAAPELAPEVAP